jgi:pimeloyl-CoA synthetase
MDVNLIFILISIVLLALASGATFFYTKKQTLQRINKHDVTKEQLNILLKDLSKSQGELAYLKIEFDKINNETQVLQDLKINADKIASQLKSDNKNIALKKLELDIINEEKSSKQAEMKNLLGKLDLYTRMDEFVEHGLFEEPNYLYETSARFTIEIKRVRELQKKQIKDKKAVISYDSTQPKQFINSQIKILLKAFNIECDALIAKVSPSTYERTLERLENQATSLSKVTELIGLEINQDYVDLKLKECQFQYQFKLKKEEEKEEQRIIREQMKEEQKAIKEYERAIKAAEDEEKLYRKLLDKAQKTLDEASGADREIAEQRIKELEQQLAEAEDKEARAKSMAEQTRKGHVYVISNIGSFGENVYKIGLTRRLEPLDRVKELGDASVPFLFDVHAMVYVDDAPSLEKALHNKFSKQRVNAINRRKEFFNTDLESIKKAVQEIAGLDAEFTMTASAEEYYETKRLLG